MKLQIPLAQLEKIANPFKQMSLEYLDSPLSIQEVEECITKGKLFPASGDSERDLLIKDISNKIINFNIQESITVNIDQPYNMKTGWIVENISQLAATIYLHEDSDFNDVAISVNIIGDENKAKKLFSPISEVLSNTPVSSKHYTTQFDWTVSQDDISWKWSDKAFVLENNNIKEIIKNSDTELWDDISFLKEFFNKYNFEVVKDIVKSDLPQEYLLKKSMLKFAQSEAGVFLGMWERVQKINAISPPKKEKILKEIIPALSNKDVLVDILYNVSQDLLAQFAHHIPMALRMDEDIEENIYRICNQAEYGEKLNLFNFFPEQYFENKENFIKFLDKVVQKDIMQGFNHPHIFKYWQESKERVLSLFDKNFNLFLASSNLRGLLSLFKKLPEELKQDKEIIQKFLQHGVIDIIGMLDYKHQADPQLIELALIKGYNGWNLSQENIFKINDPQAQKNYLSNHPEIVKDKKFPKSWLNNSDNVLTCLSYLKWSEIPDVVIQQIYSDVSLAEKFIYKEPSCYAHFPLKVKLNPDYAAHFLYKVDRLNLNTDSKLEKLLPKGIWYNQQFCINIIKKNAAYIEDVPKEFFNDKNFLIKLFSLEQSIDKDQFERILEKLPKQINIFLKSYEIEKDYMKTLDKIFLKDDLDKRLPDKTSDVPVKNKKKI